MNIIQIMNAVERRPAPTPAATTAAPTALGPTNAADLASVDLNLLVVLAVLLDETSVTRAAARLGRTQSAISHSLDRLRATFADPLFVRSGQRMVPTPRAESLRAPVSDITARLTDLVLGAPPFDPATANRRFRVTASDYLQVVLIPPLIQRIRSIAPGVSLEIVGPKSRLLERLSRGELDFSFSVHLDDNTSLYSQKLFTDGFVCLVSEDHPTVKNKLDRATYLRLPHALVAPLGRAAGHVDGELARTGESRRIAVVLPDFLIAPRILHGTDLILTLPRRVARLFTTCGLPSLEPPTSLPLIPTHLVWHERLTRDPPAHWFRTLVAEVTHEVAPPDRRKAR